MKIALLGILSAIVIGGSALAANHRVKEICGRCVGGECDACKTCNYCYHCNQGGGTCSVKEGRQ